MLPAENKFKVSSVIRDLLAQNEELMGMVSGRIFPLYAKDNTKGDFILYKREEYSIDHTKMGDSGNKCQVFVNVVSDDYDRSQDIAVLIFGILHGDYSDGMKIRLVDSTEDTVDKKYIQVLLFSIE